MSKYNQKSVPAKQADFVPFHVTLVQILAWHDGMKILILSCNTGEGHNSCAKALQAALKHRGAECDIKDTLALRSEWLSKAISDLYDFSIRTPLFGITYRLAQRYSALQLKGKSPIYAFNWLYAKRLSDLIIQGGYDGVICVHLFPAEAITCIRRRYGQYIPTIFVMTDYTCIPLLYETEVDRYVIPHSILTEEFVSKGIARNKLRAIGIPVNEDRFAESIPKDKARKIANQLYEWSEASGNWYLIMGGSMGFGNIRKLIRELDTRTNVHDRIVCLCGRNSKLKTDVEKMFPGSNKVKALGYTLKVALLMDASDVLMTKPGGITSTEAIIKNIPLVHIEPIKGLEEDNAAFFRKTGLASGAGSIAGQTVQAVHLCGNEDARQKMASIQCSISNRNCSKDIAKMIMEMVI